LNQADNPDLTKHIHIQSSSEKSFGYTFSFIFTLLALYFFIFDSSFLFIVSIFFALALIISSFFFPEILHYPNLIWGKFGELISKIISPIILLTIYILSIIPAKFFIFLLNKDILGLKFEKSAKTYWITRDTQPKNMKNQF